MSPDSQDHLTQLLGVNAVTLIYGDTGTGKSTLAATAAEYVHERGRELFGTGPDGRRVLRLYTADPGGFPSRVQALAKLGIIELWRMRNYAEPFAACERASLGYWPAEIKEGGLASPVVKLLPPIIVRYSQFCPQGHHVLSSYDVTKVSGAVGRTCPTCKTLVTTKNMLVQQEPQPNPDFARVGGIFVDGLSSWNDWVMGDMAQRSATNLLEGEKSALGGIIQSDGLTFGANNRAHYGFAQIRSQFWLTNLTTIPGLLISPIMTALEDRGSDEQKAMVYGPKIAGSAKTYMIPSWVGNCLRTAVVRGEWRLYLRQHSFPEEGSIPHLAKTRSESDALPEYLADVDDHGRPLPRFTRFSLNYFFRRLDQLLDATISDYGDRYKDLAPIGNGRSTLAPELLAEITGEAPTSVVVSSTPTVTQATAPTPTPPPAPTPGPGRSPAVPTPMASPPRVTSPRASAPAPGPGTGPRGVPRGASPSTPGREPARPAQAPVPPSPPQQAALPGVALPGPRAKVPASIPVAVPTIAPPVVED